MSRTTEIEWTEHTWNPFAGCNIHSAGCENCYAMRQAYRIAEFGTAPHYQGLTRKTRTGRIVWTGKVHRASDAGMRKPLGIKPASMIFVNSMSDFFHENAQDAWRLEALDIMRRCPRHVFQVLTKRPEHIAPFLARTGAHFPDNLWLGVTVEHADTTHRIDTLRAVPAATRFVSFEPLVGSVGAVDLSDIHWAITGGESGPGARACDADWIREIRDQCQAQGVAHFFKQWGVATNNPLWHTAPAGRRPADWVTEQDPVGKGGSLIDGRDWKEFPDHQASLLSVAQ